MDKDYSQLWLEIVSDTLHNGDHAAPRGKVIREVLQRTIEVDMRRPVLRVPERRLSYKFMAAEAFWILSGDDRVETIAPFNSHIAAFSDDGERFFGAYGPKIMGQMGYVIDKLRQDRDSRQAGLTIWRENPPVSKDIPCTVAIFFSIRENKLNAHAFMRSSDIWLGVPYDIFNFSMLGHFVCGKLNEVRQRPYIEIVTPGMLYLTAASSHLYESNFADAMSCLTSFDFLPQSETPQQMHLNVGHLMTMLEALRRSKPGDQNRWWEQ